MRIDHNTCPVCKKSAVRVHTQIEACFGVRRTNLPVNDMGAFEHDGQGYVSSGEVAHNGNICAYAECENRHIWSTYVEGMNA